MPPKKVVHYRIVPIDDCPKVVGEWIKVEDRLPRYSIECWVWAIAPGWDRRQVIDDARWYEGAWESEGVGLLSGVTHWMPYVEPEPPDDRV